MFFLGNSEINVFSMLMTEENVELELDASKMTKSFDLKCDTYKNKMFVAEKTFTSVYTPASDSTPASNDLVIEADPAYDYVACSATGLALEEVELASPIPAGTSISAKFYPDYATPATETEEAKAGGVVIKFKTDKVFNSYAPENVFGVVLLYPLASFKRSKFDGCSVSPAVADFNPEVSPEGISIFGTFDANQEYIITCPTSKVVFNYDKSNYMMGSTFYTNVNDEPCIDGCMGDAKKIEISGAFLATTIGSLIVAASALAALF